MKLSRRKLLSASTAMTLMQLAYPRAARASANYVVGAIRWDAWYGTGTTANSTLYAQQNLDYPQWQFRAPSCAQQISPYQLNFAPCDVQSAFDAEITAAHNAGLNYWAYTWYGAPLAAGNLFQNGWLLHQSSSIKNEMNWCMTWQISDLGGATVFASAFSTLVAYMQQSNYQTVLSGRPLLYIFVDQNPPSGSGWGSWSAFQTSLNAFRTACTTAGLGNPYIVMMGSNSTVALANADACGGYISVPVTAIGGAPYSAQITEDAAVWAAAAVAGIPFVPTVQCGWDTRPRSQNRTPLSAGIPWIGSNNYLSPGTPTQIASDFQAAITFVGNNPTLCPAKLILAYSWTECDEGGSALVPEWTSSGPNAAILNAVGAVLNAN